MLVLMLMLMLLLPDPCAASLKVRCLNEDVEGSCKNVFKSWSQRSDPTEHPLKSDPDDPELLLHIP
jgi:hypothetical protein